MSNSLSADMTRYVFFSFLFKDTANKQTNKEASNINKLELYSRIPKEEAHSTLSRVQTGCSIQHRDSLCTRHLTLCFECSENRSDSPASIRSQHTDG